MFGRLMARLCLGHRVYFNLAYAFLFGLMASVSCMSCTQFTLTNTEVLLLPNAAFVSKAHPDYYL